MVIKLPFRDTHESLVKIIQPNIFFKAEFIVAILGWSGHVISEVVKLVDHRKCVSSFVLIKDEFLPPQSSGAV